MAALRPLSQFDRGVRSLRYHWNKLAIGNEPGGRAAGKQPPVLK